MGGLVEDEIIEIKEQIKLKENIMFYICMLVILVLFGISAQYKLQRMDDEVVWASIIVTFCVTILFLFCFGISGLNDYPKLIKEREVARTYVNNLKLIKEARYICKSSPLSVVNGNIENMQQSSKLSEYIKEMTEKKSEYNSKLEEYKFFLNSTLWFWFGDGIFMSNKILELKPIE